LIAPEILGLDWRATPLTVTGGLSFSAAREKQYSMHAIATWRSGAAGARIVRAGSWPTAAICPGAAGVLLTKPKEKL